MLTVAVCTFRRESLAETLASLARQSLAPDRIVVADNDDAPSAEGVARGAAARYGLPLDYVHAPARNISVARNACLSAARRTGGHLAFIDDDETAPPGWLADLRARLSSGMAGVSGPSIAVYPDDAPAWMRRVAPHDQTPPRLHGRTVTGHTCNCLLDLGHSALRDLRFDPAFGRSGGEDADYFERAVRRGAVFGIADAPVYEAVPPERLSARWLAERRRRSGRTWLASLPQGRRRTVLAALPKAMWCRVGATISPDEDARRRAWMRGLFHEGVVQAGLGVRPREHYGGTIVETDGRAPSQTLPNRSR